MGGGGVLARAVTYNAEDFLTSCVDRYLELAGPGTKMNIVATPFLTKDMNQSLAEPKAGRSAAVAACLGPHAINDEGTMQPSSDSIDNFAVCDTALMGQ
eukprot:15064754-Heterocapsa_arctica.AAC.1